MDSAPLLLTNLGPGIFDEKAQRLTLSVVNKILQLVSGLTNSSRLHLKDLMRDFGCHPRTISRTIDAAHQTLGIPLRREKNGDIVLTGDLPTFPNGTGLTPHEKRAIQEVLTWYQGLPGASLIWQIRYLSEVLDALPSPSSLDWTWREGNGSIKVPSLEDIPRMPQMPRMAHWQLNLEAGGLGTRRQIASGAGAVDRTISRDLTAMRSLGLPFKAGKMGGYHLTHPLPIGNRSCLTAFERLLLDSILREQQSRCDGRFKDLQVLRERVRGCATVPRTWAAPERTARVEWIHPTPEWISSHESSSLEAIAHSLLVGQLITVKFQGKGFTKTDVVYPLSLQSKGDGWVLKAWDCQPRRIVFVAVKAIQSLELHAEDEEAISFAE